jgi:hypothetical protein
VETTAGVQWFSTSPELASNKEQSVRKRVPLRLSLCGGDWELGLGLRELVVGRSRQSTFGACERTEFANG